MADILNDLAMTIDLFSPGPYYTYLVSLSTALRSIVGVAGGATRAAITNHQARANNMAGKQFEEIHYAEKFAELGGNINLHLRNFFLFLYRRFCQRRLTRDSHKPNRHDFRIFNYDQRISGVIWNVDLFPFLLLHPLPPLLQLSGRKLRFFSHSQRTKNRHLVRTISWKENRVFTEWHQFEAHGCEFQVEITATSSKSWKHFDTCQGQVSTKVFDCLGRSPARYLIVVKSW